MIKTGANILGLVILVVLASMAFVGGITLLTAWAKFLEGLVA